MMKLKTKTTLSSLILLVSAKALAQSYELPAVDTNALFGQDSKPVQLMTSAHWFVTGMAGIAAIGFLIMAGNYASRGDWGRAGAGVVGSVITSIGAYLVQYVQ